MIKMYTEIGGNSIMNKKMLQIGLRDPIFDCPVTRETLSDRFDPIIDCDAYHWKPVNYYPGIGKGES